MVGDSGGDRAASGESDDADAVGRDAKLGCVLANVGDRG
jgi:hypothetical protein